MRSVAKGFGLNLPLPTTYRKSLETEALKRLTDEQRYLLQMHMLHSSRTARKYYQYLKNDGHVKCKNMIKDIIFT